MTFYLKYRPQTVSELDLVNVRQQLSYILKSESMPHAFLFSGPRGAGKTSAARILAKAVNCERAAAGGEPCNKCSSCKSITEGSSMDVIEIDAASNRGVDDVRSLRETVKLAASSGGKKIYIVDEAHMLTTEAANALLKTLEEPPSHVIFILATTAPERLPDTIRSRCTNIVFRKAKGPEVISSLKKAISGEKLAVPEAVLDLIAQNVDGSFREAHKVLEQLSFSGKKISLKQAEEFFVSSSFSPLLLLGHITSSDLPFCLKEIERVCQAGVNLRSYTRGIVEALRQVLLSEYTGEISSELNVEMFGGGGRVLELVEIFSRAYGELPGAVIPQLPLEMAVVKSVGGGKSKKEEIEIDIDIDGEGEAKAADGKKELKAQSAQGLEDEFEMGLGEDLSRFWRDIMSQAGSKNHSLEALLRAARPQGVAGGRLVLEVFYQFHKERIEALPFRAVLEEIASKVFGKEVKLVCVLSGAPMRAIDLVNVTGEISEDIVDLAEKIFGEGEEKKEVN